MSGLFAMLSLAAIAVACGIPPWLAVAAYGGGWVVSRLLEVRKAR